MKNLIIHASFSARRNLKLQGDAESLSSREAVSDRSKKPQETAENKLKREKKRFTDVCQLAERHEVDSNDEVAQALQQAGICPTADGQVAEALKQAGEKKA